ncbi:hypothetical protein TNCV_2511261 [Trichonephila clavipes]|nr:hypothetical protein TNCV_2511261 [Trichonephila clavipes]
MHKCVQILDKNYGALVQTARVCICVLRTNRTREAEGDFCGLPMRRDEGRVVDPPLVFKKGFLRDERKALDGENERRALDGENERRALNGENERRALNGENERRALNGENERRALNGENEID